MLLQRILQRHAGGNVLIEGNQSLLGSEIDQHAAGQPGRAPDQEIAVPERAALFNGDQPATRAQANIGVNRNFPCSRTQIFPPRQSSVCGSTVRA